jgi:hypothetical protein
MKQRDDELGPEDRNGVRPFLRQLASVSLVEGCAFVGTLGAHGWWFAEDFLLSVGNFHSSQGVRIRPD